MTASQIVGKILRTINASNQWSQSDRQAAANALGSFLFSLEFVEVTYDDRTN